MVLLLLPYWRASVTTVPEQDGTLGPFDEISEMTCDDEVHV
jgi:hypothetical protein